MATGCEVFGSTDDFDVELLTDKSAYIADSTEVIRLSLTNRPGSRPVYYECTLEIDLEEIDGGIVTKTWWMNGGEQCLRPNWISARGEVHTWNMPFSRISARNRNYQDIGEARFDKSVDYQIKVYLYNNESEDADRLIPLSERVSNRFKIERPPASQSAWLRAVPVEGRVMDHGPKVQRLTGSALRSVYPSPGCTRRRDHPADPGNCPS